ncbi:MAG: MFS transporter [Candidatus Caldarchaeum sp.]|uniref:MFS transporter n=1 Tax=Caldiarchaeum subterraneum TaxID=311458 RepID=A0A7C5QD86_CALS0
MSTGYRVILVLGLASLLGDFVYEGGRAILPDYMRQLGMNALLVGASLGLAEFAGWAARPLGGFIADKTGRYALVVRLGYGGLIVIPLMAFAQTWLPLVGLAFAERVFRGVRSPSRDAMLARLKGEVGLGTAFGIHEFMDQAGATAGPLLAIAILAIHNSTPAVYLYMAIPYTLLLISLLFIPEYSEPPRLFKQMRPSKRIFLYSAAAGLNSAGLLPLPLVLYMISVEMGEGSLYIPAAYAVAMVVDAVAGLMLGRAFDKWGGKVIATAVLISIFPALFINAPLVLLMLCSLLIGVVIGAQESVFRAMVAHLAGREGLGGSYALYGLAVGMGSAAAGVAYGYMIEADVPLLLTILYAVTVQATALTLLAHIMRQKQ